MQLNLIYINTQSNLYLNTVQLNFIFISYQSHLLIILNKTTWLVFIYAIHLKHVYIIIFYRYKTRRVNLIHLLNMVPFAIFLNQLLL